jgi:hypothetical protein
VVHIICDAGGTLPEVLSILAKNENDLDAGSHLRPQHPLKESSIKVITELFETFDAMMKYPGMKDLIFDLHSGNFMKRGTEIVITDPVMDDEDRMFNKKLMKDLKHFHYEKLIANQNASQEK